MKSEIEIIKSSAKEVNKLLHNLHEINPQDKTFEQVGFLNGLDIINEYIFHGELGLALEHLLYMIHESTIDYSKDSIKLLHNIAIKWNIDIDY